MEFWARIQSFLCLSWTLFHIIVGTFTKYHVEKAYSDKLCSDLADFELFLASLLACLATCARITECRAAIYHKGSRTCYRLPDGYQHQTCTEDLVGARLYIKGHCPSGWTFKYKSCYRLTNQEYTDKNDSEAICKGFSDKAHLVVIKTKEEYDLLGNWADWYPDDLNAVWTDASYNNGWIWSDGTTVEAWTGKHIPALHSGMCLFFLTTSSYTYSSTDCLSQLGKAQGLCELDIF